MKKSIYHRFFEISKLYHFTSFEAACKIIKSGKLRFSKAYRLNDLIESNRVVDNISYLGFDLHTMWGLYAERGYGVCLVFDKEKLMLDSDDYADDVRYVNLIPQGVIIYNKSKNGIRTEIKRRRGEIFFYKRKENV